MFNEELNKLRPLDANSAKELFLSYLNREPENHQKLLIILDGLDEVAGWEIGADLFPANINDHLKIVIAARSLAEDSQNRYWLSRLGWDRPGYATQKFLDLLDVDGVRDVLFKMGDPLAKLSFSYDIYEKLHELSKGDPLLLRLYVESLLEKDEDVAALTPQDLLNLNPGFTSYFDRWFDDQRKIWTEQYKAGIITKNEFDMDQGVKDFFRILSFAKSPLTIDDIYGIGFQKFKDQDEIRKVVKYINRFVVGDGIENGFVFSHPRLGYYFANQLSTIEQDEYKRLFFDYCDQFFDLLKNGIVEPQDVSPYVIKNYSVHLKEKETDREKFYALMCKEWLKAWEWLDGTPSGFLNDVDIAWKKAIEEGNHGISKQVLFSLCFSSFSEVIGNIPSDLFEECIVNNIINPQLGLFYISHEKDSKDKIDKIKKIFPYIFDENQKEELYEMSLRFYKNLYGSKREWILKELAPITSFKRMEQMMSQACLLSSSINLEKYYIIKYFAPFLPKELFINAINLIDGCEEEYFKAHMLSALCPYMPPETIKHAWKIVNSIENLNDKVDAFIGVVPYLTDDLKSEALLLSFHIDDSYYHMKTFESVAKYLPKELIHVSLDFIKKEDEQYYRIQDYLKFVSYLDEEQLWEILHFIEKRENNNGDIDNYLGEVLQILSPHLNNQMIDKALYIASGIQDKNLEIGIFVSFILFTSGELQETLYKKVIEYFNSVEVLKYEHIFSEITLKGPNEKFGSFIRIIKGINNESSRVKVLCKLIPYFPDEATSEVINIIDRFKSIENKIYCFSTLIPHINEIHLNNVNNSVNNIPQSLAKAKILTEILRYFPNEQNREFIDELLKFSMSITNKDERNKLIFTLAKLLPQEKRKEILNDLLSSYIGINDFFSRLNLTIEAMEFMSEEQRNLLCARILAYCKNCFTEDKISNIIKRVIPLLSQLFYSDIIKIICEFKDQCLKVQTLLFLIKYLPQKMKKDISIEIMNLSGEISDNNVFIDILITLNPFISKKQRSKIIEKLMNEGDVTLLIRFIEEYGTYLSKIEIESLFMFSNQIEDDFVKIKFLIGILRYLDEKQYSETIDSLFTQVIGIKNSNKRSAALNLVVSNFPIIFMEKVLNWLKNDNEFVKVCFFNNPNISLSEEIFDKIFEVMETMSTDFAQRRAIIRILKILQRDSNIKRAFLFAMKMQKGLERFMTLSLFFPYLNNMQKDNILCDAYSFLNDVLITHQFDKDSILINILYAYIPYLDEKGMEKALWFAESCDDRNYRFRIEYFAFLYCHKKGYKSLLDYNKLINRIYANISNININQEFVIFWQEICENLNLPIFEGIYKLLISSSSLGREKLIDVISLLTTHFSEVWKPDIIFSITESIFSIGEFWP